MIVYRISKFAFANDLSGKGAEMVGGRWNSKGIPMLYTSESRALSTVEVAVHMSLANIPSDYHITSIEVPENSTITPDLNDLPPDWKALPFSSSTQKYGDEFILQNKFLVLKVPSSVVEGDFNYLINPKHKDFNQVSIKEILPFEFDKRLFKTIK